METRNTCYRCLRCESECYCDRVQKFETDQTFIILMHPREYRKAINTGKIIRQCIANCKLYVGFNFSEHFELNQILNSEENLCYLLFPSESAIPLEAMSSETFPTGKKPVFIVLDATWHMAKKIYQQSSNLWDVQKVTFSTERKSGYKIRQQPKEFCLSSLETVHHVIVHFDRSETLSQENDNMLGIFLEMVSRQERFEISYRNGLSNKIFEKLQ